MHLWDAMVIISDYFACGVSGVSLETDGETRGLFALVDKEDSKSEKLPHTELFILDSNL